MQTPQHGFVILVRVVLELRIPPHACVCWPQLWHRNKAIILSNVAYAVVDGTPLELEVASGAAVKLFPILACAHGDTPWAAKLACACGHTAAHACHRCGIVGTKRAPNDEKLSAVSFGGVFEPSACRTFNSQGFEESEVSFARAPSGPNALATEFNTTEAARIQTTDDMYDMRANSAEKASSEEHGKFLQWHDAGSGQTAASLLLPLLLLCITNIIKCAYEMERLV